MRGTKQHIVYTIGHSTHSWQDFLSMLQSFGIKNLVDIRRFPSSRKFPYFNKENLETTLKSSGIRYLHLVELGGRRQVQKDSKNSRWRNDSFRGYADYMETADFHKAITQLETIALSGPTAYMCSEAVWWRCHRSLVSDYLKAKGWTVLHIMAAGREEEHPYTSPARIEGDRVLYADKDLFS